ncbi:MAG: hypothetical protein CM1200mP28_05250 [Deltaproteobacteria bacterium]|nr:MAG: hypothetical protein CM1200mP28_05250 [Deltaproteobacteria bacterium]
MQPTGAFKLRGATNAILRLNEDPRKRGVVAVSTGKPRAWSSIRRTGTRRTGCNLPFQPCSGKQGGSYQIAGSRCADRRQFTG